VTATSAPFLALLLPPLGAALLALVLPPRRLLSGAAHAVLALVSLGAALGLVYLVLAGVTPTWGPTDLFRVDALSALLAVCVAFVTTLSALLGPGPGREQHYTPAQIRRFRVFVSLFAFTMLVAVTANNVGVMWIAIEGTTIVSAVIVPLTVSKASVEASWKYILIGSVGIALAFVGTVLAYFDFVTLVGQHESALNWTVLLANARVLHPPVIELAFVFILIGYGTKAGLAPMHTWLPDAHSEAPSALSAMMSGVLLAVALYAIIRWKAVVASVVGSVFPNRLLVGLGLLSLAIAALSLVIQRQYKRLLAYSSIEHTGLMCMGLALGPLGVFASMLHLVNHTVAKSMMFFLSGRILDRYGTPEIGSVSGLLRVMPWTGGLFAAGMLTLLGLPPFGMFLSEFSLLRAGFADGQGWLMCVVLVFLAVAFVSLLGHLNRMLYGAAPAEVRVGEGSRWAVLPLAGCVAALIVLGIAVPAPMTALLHRIVEIAGR
jgi:hydrogenase-4 component F